VLGQARAEPADLAAMVDLVFGDVERARAPVICSKDADTILAKIDRCMEPLNSRD
jgi:hypothetical protein